MGQDGDMGRFGDGLAVDADLTRGAERAAALALEPLGGRRPDLTMVFACSADADEVAAAGERAGAVTGAPAVIGCSAPGVIGGGRGVEATSAVAVWCAVLPDVRVRTFHLEVMPA
jgi:small ligand-binding sensory domain FIST